jgi:hypothetical protein
LRQGEATKGILKAGLSQLGGLAGMTALTMGIGQERAIKEKAAQNRVAHDPELAPEETTLPIATSQNGRIEAPAVR